MKGIVALEGEQRRYVFHGVHMTLDGRYGRPWTADEDRRGEIVFIGRRLDPAEIEAAVRRCVASESLRCDRMEPLPLSSTRGLAQ